MNIKLNIRFLNQYKKYLENLPDIFTDDVSKSKSVTINYDIDSEAFDDKEFDELCQNVEGITKYQGNVTQVLDVYEETFTNIVAHIRITSTSIGVRCEKCITMEQNDAIKNLCNELTEFIFDLTTRYASKMGGIAKLMKDMEDTLGRGSGVSGAIKESMSVEDIIEAINSKTKATVSKPEVTLDDYICNDILKEELMEIKNFMENYENYVSLGIQLPKGILFKGAPGTGKTYGAKCIAGSTDCYFLSCTASSLQGMYIGSGTQNIRDIFEGAKKLNEVSGKGVIIFIDEIDSLGNREQNGSGAGGEENRTLNQLLAEMSGFEENQRIMVMAATNYEQRLDSALKRSGRFSRHITIDLPDEDEREYLLDYYFKKIKLPLEDVTPIELIDITENLTPADIKEIANESAILTVRQSLSSIPLSNINEAINKVITKNIRNKDKLDINLVSAHEAGHTLAEYIYTDSLAVKVTSYSYGDAGGFTQSAFNLKGIMPKDKFIAEIKILLAGRAAEQVMCGYITGGASSDLDRAKKIMKSYFKDYNFEKYEVEKLDQVILDRINSIQEEVIKDFEKHKSELETLTKELVDKRVLYRKDLAALLVDEGGLF